VRVLPRLYDSADEVGFDDEEETTIPRIDPVATGIRAFFETVTGELEDTQPFFSDGATHLRRRS
jgi:hypothetical protein